MKRMRILAVGLLAAIGIAGGVSGSTVNLTIGDARARAIAYNRSYLEAKEELAKAETQIVTARAGILPNISASAGYTRGLKIPSMFLFTDSGAMEIKTGAKNQYSAGITVQQPLWEGGKVLQAWAIARQYRAYAEDNLSTVQANVIFNAEALFYDVILRRSNLDVLNQALSANTENLSVVEKLYNRGMVSEYELLRARVERSNLLPAILQSESDVRLSESRLKSFLGLRLGDTLQVIEQTDDTSLTKLPSLDELTKMALEARPEVMAAGHLENMTRRAVSVAKGAYWPTLDAFTNYTWQSQSDQFRLDKNQTKSWTAGIALSIPIFNGFRTGGSVSYYKADYRKTKIQNEQLRDDVTLEVQQAYDRLMQAKKSLEVQHETIAQAEEGLRIAKVRYESGVGTQLEVLSAQSALTDARRSLVSALNFFRAAKAGLKKATTIDLDAK
jgi:outer membrane protein